MIKKIFNQKKKHLQPSIFRFDNFIGRPNWTKRTDGSLFLCAENGKKIPWTIQETFQKSGHQKTLPEAWRAACLLSETMVGRSSRMLRILIGARIFGQKCFWLLSKSSILELNTLIKEGHFYGKSSMYRKIALISDIHGNMTAFQAVCDDLKKQKINEVWFLGDMFSPGPGALVGRKNVRLLGTRRMSW